MTEKKYQRGDYVIVNYDGENLTGKVMKVEGNTATVEVCLSARRGEKLLTDEVTIDVSKIKNLGIKKN